MYRWFIVVRYLFSRIMTFAVFVLVASSVALLSIIVCVMEGFQSELRNRIRGTSSDLKVESRHYLDLENPDRVAAAIAGVPGVRAAAPYAETVVLYRAEEGRLGPGELEERFLRVIDLERELQVGDLSQYVRDVRFSRLPTDPRVLFSKDWTERGLWKEFERQKPVLSGGLPPPILVGREAFRREWLLPGTIVSLTGYAPRSFAPRTRRFLVAGYFKTGLYELDAKGILMDRAAGAEFLGLKREDGVELASGLRVAVEPGWEEEEGLQRLRAGVEAALAKADIFFTRTVTWREERAALLQAVRVEKAIMSFIIGMVVLFSAFMIFIILTLQVVEKTRDLGVLQSVGATPAGVARIFLALGMVLCFAGAAVGTVYGLGFAAGVNTIQRWIKLLTGVEVFSPEVYYLDRIPVRFAPWDLAFIIGLSVLVGLIASLIPALRAARKDPVVALRYE